MTLMIETLKCSLENVIKRHCSIDDEFDSQSEHSSVSKVDDALRVSVTKPDYESAFSRLPASLIISCVCDAISLMKGVAYPTYIHSYSNAEQSKKNLTKYLQLYSLLISSIKKSKSELSHVPCVALTTA